MGKLPIHHVECLVAGSLAEVETLEEAVAATEKFVVVGEEHIQVDRYGCEQSLGLHEAVIGHDLELGLEELPLLMASMKA